MRVWNLPAPGDISRALTQHPEDYTLSLGHMGDLTIASFASGALHHTYGWRAVNLGVIAPVILVSGAIVWLLLRRRPAAA